METALLAGIIAVPAVLMFLLKSNPAIAFLSVCAGGMLQQFCTRRVTDLASAQKLPQSDTDHLSLVLLVLPLLLTLIFMRKSIHRNKFLMYAVPAVCTGALLALLAAPHLGAIGNFNIAKSKPWQQFEDFQAIIVGAGVVSSLFIVWLTKKKIKEDKDKKGH